MNGLPYYRRRPRDFFEGTVGMPFEVKGAYSLVLDLIYMHSGSVPDDPRYISGHLGCSSKQWTWWRKALIERGKLIAENGVLRNDRASMECEWADDFVRKQRENGTKTKHSKRLPEAVAKPSHKPKANHINKDIYIPPLPPKGGRSKSMKKVSPFPPDFPYDHRLMFGENLKRLAEWQAEQEKPS